MIRPMAGEPPRRGDYKTGLSANLVGIMPSFRIQVESYLFCGGTQSILA
jgi:hypothetical protein